MSPRRRLVLATLHRLSAAQLLALARIERQRGKVVGFHEIATEILFLAQKTGLQKYGKLCDDMLDEFEKG